MSATTRANEQQCHAPSRSVHSVENGNDESGVIHLETAIQANYLQYRCRRKKYKREDGRGMAELVPRILMGQ